MDVRRLLEFDDGWHDGSGAAPSNAVVAWLRRFVAELHAGTELLAIFPTLGGGALAEAQIGERRWSLEVEPDGAMTIAEGGPHGTRLAESEDAGDAARSFERFAGSRCCRRGSTPRPGASGSRVTPDQGERECPGP